MGIAEVENSQVFIHSHIITYGNATNEALTALISEEIESMWNEPNGTILLNDVLFQVIFKISSSCSPDLTDIAIFQNLDPRNNYFRIEEFAHGNISFVDGLGCNTGYFKLENLYKGSTTAAHEYGHTLGLDHPNNIDLRGKGIPGIMFPRGTLVDPEYQYEPDKPAGTKGGTMHPMYRKVKQADIELLKLHNLEFENNIAIIGAFTNYWHPDHATINDNGEL